MRIVRKFKVKEHEDYGNVGLVMANMPTFEPFEGMGVAHDIFEHFPNDTGTAVEEYMALGASLFVRNMGDYHQYNKNPVHHLEGGIEMILRYIANGGGVIGTIGRTLPVDEKDVEECIQAIPQASKRHLLSERPPDEDEWSKELHATAEKLYPLIIPAMRTGFRKARRRYADISRFDLCELFKRTEKAINNWLHEYSYALGLKTTITIDTRTHRIDITEPEE